MSGLTRRDMLKRGVGLAGMVWVAPSVNSVGLTLAQAETTSPVGCAPTISIEGCEYQDITGAGEFWVYSLKACSTCECAFFRWYVDNEFDFNSSVPSGGCSTDEYLLEVGMSATLYATCVQFPDGVESGPSNTLFLDGTGCTGGPGD